MNRLSTENKKEKNNNSPHNLVNLINTSEKLYPSKNVNLELKNQINRNILVNDLANDDIYKDNDSFQITTMQNPIDMYSLEYNNINYSLMNSTKDYKFSEYFDYVQPLFKLETNNNKDEKIFKVKKINKKIGRLKKNSLLKGIHNKFSEDNIIRKIKRRFLEKVRLYINEEYKNYCIANNIIKGKNNWLKKIDPNFSRKIKKRDNLQWFNLKIFEVFSENLSSKYTSYEACFNKKKIQNFFLLKKSNKIKDILNMSVEALFNIFITNSKFGNFKTLNDDIIEIEKRMEILGQENIKEYLEKYKRTANNMKAIFIKKIGRNLKNY